MKIILISLIMCLSACAETSSTSVARTKKYLDYVSAVQNAQEKLNAFIAAESKACEVANQTLQLGGNGVLACVPKPTPPPAPAPEVKK